jgi:hypothetical protein
MELMMPQRDRAEKAGTSGRQEIASSHGRPYPQVVSRFWKGEAIRGALPTKIPRPGGKFNMARLLHVRIVPTKITAPQKDNFTSAPPRPQLRGVVTALPRRGALSGHRLAARAEGAQQRYGAHRVEQARMALRGRPQGVELAVIGV